jgi:predicted N-acetyltransferase YhbS
MARIIRTVNEKDLDRTLDFVEKVFTDSETAEDGKIVRNLLAEIRSKKYYLPELDLIMVDENNELMGHVMFSRFHIEGKYENEFLILTPVSVKTELQRQHISRDMIEYGLAKAREMGYKFCMVEGNPMNYRERGFQTSADFGIFADESVGLPHPDCLMIQELVPGGLEGVHGYINYKMYESLR